MIPTHLDVVDGMNRPANGSGRYDGSLGVGTVESDAKQLKMAWNVDLSKYFDFR